MTMKRFLPLSCAAVLAASVAVAQDYKLETVSTAPPGAPASYSALMAAQGYRLNGSSGPWCEVWLRKQIPGAAKSGDQAVSFSIAQGTLLGILRFPGQGADRRGQVIKPGAYTMRYSLQPADGAHVGSAPQRDFVLLTPIGNDPDPNAMPGFEGLVQMSVKASGTAHPAVLSLETPGGSSQFPSVTREGESDWVLNAKAGDLPLAIILVGKVSA